MLCYLTKTVAFIVELGENAFFINLINCKQQSSPLNVLLVSTPASACILRVIEFSSSSSWILFESMVAVSCSYDIISQHVLILGHTISANNLCISLPNCSVRLYNIQNQRKPQNRLTFFCGTFCASIYQLYLIVIKDILSDN